jgi:Skp family chaperone for outer membrane proteins
MKTKTIILGSLAGLIIFCSAYEFTLAAPKDRPETSKIGVVNIQKVLLNSQKNKTLEENADAERRVILNELEKLSREIDAEKAGLNTLKAGTSDYMAQLKTIMEKQANLQVQQKFQEQQLSLKYLQRLEELYRDLLQITARIAQEKGLVLVLTKDEIDFPAGTIDNLMMAIRTNKLLYSDPGLDISDEVIARLDAEK